MTTKKIFFKSLLLFLASFLIFLSFFAPIFFLWQKKKEKLKIGVVTTPPEATPIYVNVSNIFPFGFTVSFTSLQLDNNTNTLLPKATTGKVLLSQNSPIENEESLNVSIFFDKRGENYQGTIHYVEIKNLKPETIYTFKIKSGPTIYSYKEGTPNWITTGGSEDMESVKTPAIIGDETKPPSTTNPYGAYSLESGAFLPCPDGTNNPKNIPCFRPNPILIETNGKSDVIAYFLIENKEKVTISSLLSCLTDSSGKCLIDLANFWKEDFSTYLPYNPSDDKLLVWANGGDKGNSPLLEKQIPEVIADACLSDSLHCNTSPKGESTVLINLIIPPSPTQTPTPTLTPTPECNLLGDLNCDGHVNEADFSVIFQNWTD